ncbi:MAG: type II secretion system GspH family protein [Defluviitaleaceae bacterium]|nr:type II secretion system GspH family protein [Defluviitaleaceae bacterium]
MQKKINKKQNGFTIIELIIFLAIFTIASSVIFPSFSTRGRRQILNAARVLASDIRNIQQRAMQESTRYTIEFFQNTNIFIISNENFNDVNYLIYDNIIFEQVRYARNRLEFTERGTPSGGGTIILRNNSYMIELTTTVSSGRVQIRDVIKLY